MAVKRVGLSTTEFRDIGRQQVQHLANQARTRRRLVSHWQRNWHKYAAAGVLLGALLGVGAAVAFGPSAPIVFGFFASLGKALVGTGVIASLSPALSTAVAWLGVMGTAVSFTASGWGLSKLFGLANDFKGLATASVEDEALNSEPSGEKTPRNSSYSGLLSEFGRPSKLAFQEADAGEHETASSRSSRSSSRISSLPGHTTFMPEGRIEFSDSESGDERQEFPDNENVVTYKV